MLTRVVATLFCHAAASFGVRLPVPQAWRWSSRGSGQRTSPLVRQDAGALTLAFMYALIRKAGGAEFRFREILRPVAPQFKNHGVSQAQALRLRASQR